jgi:DNA-binding HxlR family transcriptional regulator
MRSRGATLRTASSRLAGLSHHRFALAALAELHAGRGAKVVTLVRRLGASREAVRRTLSALSRRGLVRRNPGYGHPMRPEWILTSAGLRVAPACAALLRGLREAGASEVARRKWALPVLHALLAGEARFSRLRRALGGVTDRALAATLRDLEDAGVVSRRVVEDRPPRVLYAPAQGVSRLRPALERLAASAPAVPEATPPPGDRP